MIKNYTTDDQHNRSFLRGLLPPKGWLVLVLFMMFSASSFGQTTEVRWRSEAANGDWDNGNCDAIGNVNSQWFYVGWGDDAPRNEPDCHNGDNGHWVKFNNNHQTTMYLNHRWYNVNTLEFQAGATSNRTFELNGINLRDHRKIENNSTGSHTFNSGVAIHGGQAEFNPFNGDLTFGYLAANNNWIHVKGNNWKWLTFNNEISGNGGLHVRENSIVRLNAAMTFTGGIVLDAGEVRLLANDRIANSCPITLNGGIFNATDATAGAGVGRSDTMGTLRLQANSTLYLGTSAGAHTLTFAASNGVGWTGGTTLTIHNWEGTAGSAGTKGKIFVGTTDGGLTSTQLAQINFNGHGTGAMLLSNGELVPKVVTGPAITGAKLGVIFNGGGADWGYAGLQDGCEGAIGAWHGKNLGTMSVTGSLVLDGANVFTNTAGSTNGILYYRVYKSDDTPPAYDTYNIGSTQTNCGSSFKYENPTDFTIPSSKYSVAGTYRFEVYYEITNGSTLSQGSAVSPYQATFTITEPTNDTFYSDRIYFKNGTASSEKYYAEYNAVPNGGCTGDNAETAGTEAWNGRNLGTYTTGTTAQLGAFIVTKGVQNGNGPRFLYRVYETGSTPPVFLQSNLNYVGECNADGVQVNGSDMDKIWRLPLSNISIPSTPGNYTIEVYFERSGDQMGNNGTQYISNGGSNYKAYIDVQPPTGIISSKVYLKKNSDAEIVYLAGADTDCDPGGTVNFNGLSTGIVTADAYKIGGNFISTLAMTSPKLNYLLYPSGARPSSPVFSEITLSNVSTCSTRFKYEASSATQLFNSNDIVSGTYVLELYFSGVNGGTTYYKRPDPTNNYVSYFTISEPNDGNLNPTGTNISGIYETYMGQLILGLDDNGNPNTSDRKISKVYDLDGNYSSSNNVNFDLGSTSPGVSFKVGMEAKVFTKGTHKACGCSSWYYLYKDGATDPVESDFPLPSAGSTAVLYSQKWGSSVRKFTLMNSSMSWQGLNTPFQALTGNVSGYGDNSSGFGSTTPDGTYNGQLGTGASVVKYKDYKDRDAFSPANTNMAVDTPVNEVACPTCDGTYRIAVALLCWVQTDNTKKCPGDSGFSSGTDAPTIIYHRDINQNKIHNGVYLNPRHPSSPYFTNNKNSLPGTTVFYVSKLNVNASGGDTTYNGSWNNGTPNRGKNTFINANYSTASGSFITNNLTIANGITLTIRSGEYVEVLNTATTGTGAKIVVEKGGNFVQRCNEKIPANGVPYPNIEHTHQTRTIAPYDYVYWSSPIREDVMPTLYTAGMGRMFHWQGGAGGGWQRPTTTAADTFGAGKGFIAWNAGAAPAAFAPTFIGTATNGEVSVAVTKEDVYPDESDAAALATYSSNFNNYALLGNPYPCALDAREFLVHANNQHLGGTIYIWTSNSRLSEGTRGVYDEGDYATYTLAGGTAAANAPEYAYGETSGNTYGNNSNYAADSNRMIYSGSGFFILVKEDGDAFFNNEMRSITGNSNSSANWALFKQKSGIDIAATENEENRLWLSVRNEKGAYRQTLLSYINGATEGFDGYLDAVVNSENSVNLYTKSKHGHKLVIQARPESLLDNNETVPLILSSKEADDFYITVDMFEGKFKNKDIYLRDKKLGVDHEFSTGKYHFSTESGVYEDRFEIVYKDKPKASVEEAANAGEPLKIAVADHVISISKAGQKITNVEFTNILGKRIKTKSFDSLDVATVSDIIKANQVLIVKVTYADGTTETKKIVF